MLYSIKKINRSKRRSNRYFRNRRRIIVFGLAKKITDIRLPIDFRGRATHEGRARSWPLSYATITISDDVTDEQRIEKAASDIRQVGERSGLRINVATVLNVDECRTNERGRHACRFETTVSLRNGSLDTREEPCPSSCEFRILVNRPRRIGSRRPLYVAADICQN